MLASKQLHAEWFCLPEGDTIWKTAAGLRPHLAGRRILSARPDRFRALDGSTLISIDPSGKHLVMSFDNGLAVHSHMRMTGSWHLYRPGEPWQKPERLARLVLTTENAVAVCFSAPVVNLLRQKEVRLDHLGPDILGADWDVEEIVRRARESAAPTLGEVLLDQRVTAGIGNIYKCESLWDLRLDPWKPVVETDDANLGAVFSEARRLLLGSIGQKAGPGRHFPSGHAAVHGRGGKGCPRCLGRIAVGRQGQAPRFTYFCPTCQQGGPPVDPRSPV